MPRNTPAATETPAEAPKPRRKTPRRPPRKPAAKSAAKFAASGARESAPKAADEPARSRAKAAPAELAGRPRKPSVGRTVARAIEAGTVGKAFACACDISDMADCDRFVEAVLATTATSTS